MNPQSPYDQGGQGPYQPQQATPPQQMPIPNQAPQQPPYPGYAAAPTPPIKPTKRHEQKLWTILTIVFIITTLIAAGIAVAAYVHYLDQKNNVDSKVTAAVATAVKDQQDKDAEKYAEQEKQPNRQFAGPDDYGRLAFDYPKTWSVYVAKDAASGGNYEAYFNPVAVPEVSKTNRYALHVTIEQTDYDQVIKNYEKLVSSGELKSTVVNADGQTGTRLDGSFTKDLKGSAVIFKIRDKTVTVRTDAATFETDFNALVKTITFNK